MSKVNFVYYLTDTDDQETRCEAIMAGAESPLQIDDDLAEKIGQPFYEVMLDCTLDTDTGEVTIRGAAT